MPDGNEPLIARTVGSISKIGREAWNACTGKDNPFTSYEFLSALEDSGSVGEDAGWLPQHMVVEDANGQAIGVAPLYLKNHSYGEYVFDHAWADAYERAGGRYYPKLQSAVPFTPATGRRLLTKAGHDPMPIQDALFTAMIQFAERLGVSSLHITFPTVAEWERGQTIGLLGRIGEQFHWHNRGYETFDDFLAAFTARKRKAIRKERREALAGGLTVRTLTGDELQTEHWDSFFGFYISTSNRKWGWPYLNREFFDLLHQRMADQVVLFLVEDDRRPIAGALNLRGSDALYGRNWGCIRDVRFLHFETCYYQAIDYAIAHGLQRVEAGAQGPHKIQRGYLPVETYSLHWIADPALERPIADYLARETLAIRREIMSLSAETPYRLPFNER